MLNELVFIATVGGVFGFVSFAYVFGRRWLYAAIVINLVLIGVFGATLVPLFGGVTNVGNIFYVAVFFVGQLLVEHYGRREAMKSIWIGLAATIFFVLMGQLTIAFSSAPATAAAASTLHTLFEFAPRITFASLLAYLFSQTLNIQLYSYVSAKRPQRLWVRSIIASSAGQLLDSVIFFTVAFSGSVLSSELIQVATTGFLIKVFVGALSIPFLYLSYRLKHRKGLLEEEYEAILAGIGEGLVVTDKFGTLLTVNKVFEEVMRTRAQDAIGKNIVDVLPLENESGKVMPFEERILTRVIAGHKVKTPMTSQVYFRRKDGTRFPVNIIVSPIRIDHSIVGAVELFSDVTAQLQLEQTRRDFLSLASHQLRTPLSSARWVIETLQEGIAGEMNEKQKKYIAQLNQVNAQLIKLATDTLAILRFESGVVPIKRTQFPVTRLYGEVMKTLSAAAQEGGVKLRVVPKPAISIETDFSLARNIIESLVTNAINYSSAGAQVLLDCEEGAGEVRLSVKDEGIGIPQDEQARIFDRFYRASNAKAMKADGSGLGLPISQMLAEKLGGTLTFSSAVGKGSTFTLSLPKHASRQPPL